jgi:hypothetical protein
LATRLVDISIQQYCTGWKSVTEMIEFHAACKTKLLKRFTETSTESEPDLCLIDKELNSV